MAPWRITIWLALTWTSCGAATYYVSSSGGNDLNDGLSPADAFATIAHINTLLLQPGDEVLFLCGDTWRGEMLVITRSGSAALPIRYGSYPTANCSDKPTISGAYEVTGWTPAGGSIYVADLDLGGNAGKFPLGMNQLFRGNDRLAPGRWPNVDEGDGGYSTIDSQPAANQIQDNELPSVNWDGALVHIKGMRWYIINRFVTATLGNALQLNEDNGCWAGDCTDWGFFINNHPATLDRDGEWYYDASSNQVHLYSDSVPVNMEASTLMAANDDFRGGIVLGRHLAEHISYVIVENFEVMRWDMHGITTPTNLQSSDNFNVTLRNNVIRDVDAAGINLQTWVWQAAVGPNGWRGGHDQLIENNYVEGANHFGINAYAYDTEFRNNVLVDIGLINNAGLTGIGCGDTSFGGFCTESGDGLRIKIDQPDYSGFGNLITCNQLYNIGHNGMDVFGGNNDITRNIIKNACSSKGDCGAVRTFGSGSLATSPVHDILLSENIIVDVIGNTDGNAPFFKPLFGIGLYIDQFSANVTASDNTIVGATIDGILYQNSSGTINDNILYGNNAGTMFRGQVGLYGGPTAASLNGNVMVGRQNSARTLIAHGLANITGSNFNYFFNAFENANIVVGAARSLSQWQAFSGLDAQSVANWYVLTPPEPPLAEIFINESKNPSQVDLGASVYLDLDQNTVTGSFTLQPFRSRVLVPQFICNPTAALTGDSTICSGGNATLSVELTGTGPWDLTWSDGFMQTGVMVSPATRVVTPITTTTYWIDQIDDSLCTGMANGLATVIVGDNQPLSLDPPSNAQGLYLLQFTARIPCTGPTLGWEWLVDGGFQALDVNPFSVPWVLTQDTTVTVEVDQGGPLLSATALVLVAQHHSINRDLNGDNCNSLEDLWLLMSTWRQPSTTDPNDNGIVEVRDFLYINTDQVGCP